MSIQTNRTLGGVAAIFSLLGVVSTASSLLLYGFPSLGPANLAVALVGGFVGLFSFIGFIMFLVAMHGFSKDYREPKIFNYVLYGLLTAIVAGVIAAIVVIALALSNFASIFPSLNPSTTNPTQVTNSILSSMAPLIAVFSFVGLMWVVFEFLAFNLLAKKSEVPLFKTAAYVMLIGGVVTVGVSVLFGLLAYWGAIDYNTYLLAAIPGGIVQYAAWALLAMAFFRIKVPTTQPYTNQYAPAVTGPVKYCTNCGTPNKMDSLYCIHCGQKLQT